MSPSDDQQLAYWLIEQRVYDAPTVSHYCQLAASQNMSLRQFLAQNNRLPQNQYSQPNTNTDFENRPTTKYSSQGLLNLGQTVSAHPNHGPNQGPQQGPYTGPQSGLQSTVSAPQGYDSGRQAGSPDSGQLKTQADPAELKELGPFKILGVLGAGGMGMVYKAKHQKLDKLVALKVLLPNANHAQEVLNRFIAEAQTVAKLDSHPHIVKVIDSGEVQGRAYMAMELIDGASFDELIKAGKVEQRAGARVVADIARALAHAHDQGIIHRDVKPQNILIDRKSTALLTDFGVAKADSAATAAGMTATGAVVGTLSYMAPEQAEDAKNIDHRADVYGIGAVLYHILTGRAPHIGVTPTNILMSLATKEVPPPQTLNPKANAVLSAICMKALAKNPDRRYQSAHDLADDIDAFRSGHLKELHVSTEDLVEPKAQATPWGAVLVVASVIATLALLLLIVSFSSDTASSEDPKPPVEAKDPKPTKPVEQKPAPEKSIEIESVNVQDNALIGKKLLELVVRVKPNDARVIVGDRTKTAEAGVARLTIPIAADQHSIKIEVNAKDCKTQYKTIPIVTDFTPPRFDKVVVPTQTLNELVTISGFVYDDHPVELFLGRERLSLDRNQRFEHQLKLNEGVTRIQLRAVDKAGNSSETEEYKVEYKRVQISLRFNDESGVRKTNNKGRVSIRAKFSPKNALVFVGEERIKTKNGSFKYNVPLDKDVIHLKFKVKYGQFEEFFDFTVVCDYDKPQLTLLSPDPETKVINPSFVVRLSFNEKVKKVEINGKEQDHDRDSLKFESRVSVPEGATDYKFKVMVKDLAGNETKKEFGPYKIIDSRPELSLRFKPMTIRAWLKNTVTLSGAVKDQQAVTLTCLGEPVKVAKDGSFRHSVPVNKLYKGLSVIAVDSDGNTTIKAALEPLPLLQDHEIWAKASEPKAFKTLKPIMEQELRYLQEHLKSRFKINDLLKEFRCGKGFNWIGVFEHRSSDMEFCVLPGGRYVMGAGLGNTSKYATAAEKPAHKVTLKPFLLGRYEVREREFMSIGREWILENGNKNAVKKVEDPSKKRPIDSTDHNEIKEWLEAMEDGFRLPSESEWEYAARAGAKTAFYWGDVFDMSYCWCGLNAKERQSHVEHRKKDKHNAFGLIDMLGNVGEVVADTWFDNYKGAPTDGSARIAKDTDKDSETTVLRGGRAYRGQFGRPRDCRLSARYKLGHRKSQSRAMGIDDPYEQVGFRVAVTIPWDKLRASRDKRR